MSILTAVLCGLAAAAIGGAYFFYRTTRLILNDKDSDLDFYRRRDTRTYDRLLEKAAGVLPVSYQAPEDALGPPVASDSEDAKAVEPFGGEPPYQFGRSFSPRMRMKQQLSADRERRRREARENKLDAPEPEEGQAEILPEEAAKVVALPMRPLERGARPTQAS